MTHQAERKQSRGVGIGWFLTTSWCSAALLVQRRFMQWRQPNQIGGMALPQQLEMDDCFGRVIPMLYTYTIHTHTHTHTHTEPPEMAEIMMFCEMS